ncbi:P-loop containing nucleoside triphosphate hydrolase protein [Amylocystis lapponica]|nr:P-loop containing nucleoside triphosphate hydrolase protein [Amylocystis lapponica]
MPSEREPIHGVGLSDAQSSRQRRALLDLINRMRNTGVQQDIDIPMIAVIGSQSAGKSSLIESISGITLPRASGTCTRCPTGCRLSHSDKPWQCSVSLHFTTDERGEPLKQVRNVTFGDPIADKAEVEERIRRAQRAILNPHTNYLHILQGDVDTSVDSELTFSMNFVSLQITGRDIADLSFVDLPGLIASGGSPGDIGLVTNLVTSYVSRPSCIILLTVACETDFENQGAHNLAKVHDPEGKRTIGVLTKPNQIPAGEEDRWLRFLRNEFERLDNGWYSVKQPDSQALAAGISWSEARAKELEYFSGTTPWSTLDFSSQQYLGTSNLTERCSDVLSTLIARRLPELQNELEILLQATEENISKLPTAPSDGDPVGQVLNLLSDFYRGISKYVEGTPTADGLLQSIQPLQMRFRKAIRATAPDFRPYEKVPGANGDGTLREFVVPEFLAHEESPYTPPEFLAHEESPYTPPDDRSAIYVDDVMKRAREAMTRELPNIYPFVVTEHYIRNAVLQWQEPAYTLLKEVLSILLKKVKEVVRTHFEQYPYLQQIVTATVGDYITSSSKATTDRIAWFLNAEKRARTLNSHYYCSYRDKFFAHYKGCRPNYGHATLYDNTSQPPEGSNHVDDILSNFSALGVRNITRSDLAKVLPSDPHEDALVIMARVRAYFQVAYKRFADNIPIAIDEELILSLDKAQRLESLSRQRLGIHSADGERLCAEYLQEPSNISQRRAELKKKKDRLVMAKKELMELCL